MYTVYSRKLLEYSYSSPKFFIRVTRNKAVNPNPKIRKIKKNLADFCKNPNPTQKLGGLTALTRTTQYFMGGKQNIGFVHLCNLPIRWNTIGTSLLIRQPQNQDRLYYVSPWRLEKLPEREGTLGRLLHQSPKFYDNVFLFVCLTTLETLIKFDWLVY